MNFRDIINNKYYLSFTLGLVVSIVIYGLEYNKKEESKIKKHLKIFLVASIVFLLGMFLSNNISPSTTSSSISGGGSIDLKLEDLNLDDPFSA